MDRSRLSNIIAVTRVLQHFTPQSIELIKPCIFKELKCQNESDFICKALYLMYKSLSFESTTIIKNAAIQLADSPVQVMRNNTVSDNKETDTICMTADRSLTINKYIEEKYNDPFSKSGSDIIDYIGTFLKRQDSIVLGHSNKQLFIETQKDSYLLKNDDELDLNDKKMMKMIETHSDGYPFCFCSNLHMTLKNNNYRHEVRNIACYNNFFDRLKVLSCNVISLSYVPIELLFNIGGDNKNDNHISRLIVNGGLSELNDQDIISAMQVFEAKYDGIDFNSCCGNIDTINFSIVGRDRGHVRADQKILQKVVTRLGYLGRSIIFSTNTNLLLRNRRQLECVFHPKLHHVSFLSNSFELQVSTMIENVKVDVPMLNKISIQVVTRYPEYGMNRNGNYDMTRTFDCMNRFSLRKNVTYYKIFCDTSNEHQ